jgi:hypothetical protein
MTDKRKAARAEARQRRTAGDDEARQKVEAARCRVASALKSARAVLADSTFIGVLRSHGIKDVPRFLMTRAEKGHGITSELELDSRREKLDDGFLDFVIAWTFFFPLFASPAIADYLDSTWPGFTLELKDAFISAMVDGSFPG